MNIEVYYSETRLATKTKGKKVKGRFAVWNNLVFLLCLALPISGCSRGPSESQILSDYEEFAKKAFAEGSSECPGDVKVNKIKVAGISNDGNIADVIVQITGDWIGKVPEVTSRWFDRSNYFDTSPCAGFIPKAGKNQTVERRFIYKKFDSGWRLQGNMFVR